MKWFRWIWLAGTLALLGEAFYQAMYLAPTEATMGDIQRIFYYHFPSAMLTFLFFFISLVASIAYLALRHRDPLRAMHADALALAAAEMGVVFCTAVLIGTAVGATGVGHLVDVGRAADQHAGDVADLLLLPAGAALCRGAADADAGGGGGDLRVCGCPDRLLLDTMVAHTTSFAGDCNRERLDPSMWPAVWWNLAAWLAWGLMVMGFRYAIERRRQLREQDEALRALEATLEATPWKENE